MNLIESYVGNKLWLLTDYSVQAPRESNQKVVNRMKVKPYFWLLRV